ncbi:MULTISPECIES: NADH-quinone oxidoreductase subunit K [Ruegeria]|nr:MULTISPECIES: NADH-quinone oxidoreductase subunit K [Ruegeria]UWR08385.1 NADH-quinone oxidoreductase subunit K [Ruegeria sp. B32]
MMPTLAPYIVAGAMLVGLGLFGLFTDRKLLRQIIALNIINAGVFLLLIASSGESSASVADPVPRAMVLTGVVVAVSATALALALATRLHQVTGETRLSVGTDDEAGT